MKLLVTLFVFQSYSTFSVSILNDPTGTIVADYNVNIKEWPTIPATTLSDTIVQSLGAVFFFCSAMVIFINVLNQIVTEKEMKLRHGMEVMGLKVIFADFHFLTKSRSCIGSVITSLFPF